MNSTSPPPSSPRPKNRRRPVCGMLRSCPSDGLSPDAEAATCPRPPLVPTRAAARSRLLTWGPCGPPSQRPTPHRRELLLRAAPGCLRGSRAGLNAECPKGYTENRIHHAPKYPTPRPRAGRGVSRGLGATIGASGHYDPAPTSRDRIPPRPPPLHPQTPRPTGPLGLPRPRARHMPPLQRARPDRGRRPSPRARPRLGPLPLPPVRPGGGQGRHAADGVLAVRRDAVVGGGATEGWGRHRPGRGGAGVPGQAS